VYVTGRGDDTVSVFARDAGTGALTLTAGGATGLPDAHDLTLAPDGTYLYVSSTSGVTTFSRDAGSGALALVATFPLGSDVAGTSVSPDGAHLYVRRFNARELLEVYARDASGGLTLTSEVRENEPGLSADVGQLFFTADGGTGFMGGAIFSRHPVNGSLGFVDRPSPLPGRNGAYALGPNGEVYTSSSRSVQRWAPGYAGCAASPLPVCHGAGGGTLRVGFRAPSVTLSWLSAGTVVPSEFGSPDLTDHYALCVYDESGPTPALILGAVAPAAQLCTTARGCWTPNANGFVYRDRVRTPEGISALTLKGGTAARIRLVAGKGHLDFPGLPFPLPIRLQVQSSAGACFEATYSAPSVNSAQAFLARPD
jgi:hypothetical protein